MMDPGVALRAVLKSCVLPPVGPLWAIAVGFGLYRGGRAWGRFAIYGGVLVLLALSLPVVADRLTLLASTMPAGPVAQSHPQAIVILSGGLRTNSSRPSGAEVRAVTLARLAEGARLARQYRLPILVSGGAVEAGPADAVIMAESLRENFGLMAEFVEDRSLNTHENAVESARILKAEGIHQVMLVTSAVHLPRARSEFVAAGLAVDPAPAGGLRGPPHGLMAWIPQPWALESSHAALYEFLGRLAMGAADKQ